MFHLLRLWVKEENKKYVQYFLLLSLIFAFILPQLLSIFSIYNSNFVYLEDILYNKLQLKYVCGFTAYFILGWYIHNFGFKNNLAVYILGIIGFVITFFGTFLLTKTSGEPVQMYDSLYVNVLLQSVAVFTFIKSKFTNMLCEKKSITILSSTTLGIYAIHVFFIKLSYMLFEKVGFDLAIVTIPCVCIVTLILSFIISFTLKKIPYINYVV